MKLDTRYTIKELRIDLSINLLILSVLYFMFGVSGIIGALLIFECLHFFVHLRQSKLIREKLGCDLILRR